MSFTAERYHDFSYGHRVVGHENKCRHLHGHNGRVHFVCKAQPNMESLDHIGRVIDFGVIKERLCMWIENNWDHKFLFWKDDPVFELLRSGANHYNVAGAWDEEVGLFEGALVEVPFNPTAENMAQYLVEVIGPQQLEGTGVVLVQCIIEETAKCSASFIKD